MKSEEGHIYLHEGQNIDGYIIYFINGEDMVIREIYYTNIESLKSMLKFVYNHNTQCKKVTISAPINDKIRFVLANPRTADIKLKPFMMGRIINFKKYLESLYIDNDGQGNISIFLKDRYIKDNNGVFNIKLENHKLTIEKGNFDYDIELDINTMTQLAFSYVDIKDALFINNLEINDDVIDFFNRVFDKKDNYINEYI